MTEMRGFWIKKRYVCGESEYECSACLETEWRTSIGRFKFCPFLRHTDGWSYQR